MSQATALMARDLGTRGTLDIDLYREISLAAAEADLRRAAAADIGDWFWFDVGAATPVATVGVRLAITSVVGTTIWFGFHIELTGSGLRMTGQPEHVPPLAENAIPEVARHVDLMSIITGASVPTDGQTAVLVSEFDRRQLDLPASFDVPDRCLREPGYAAEARRSLLTAGRTLNEALTLVKPFIDPLLDQSATGHWDPGSRRWRGRDRPNRPVHRQRHQTTRPRGLTMRPHPGVIMLVRRHRSDRNNTDHRARWMTSSAAVTAHHRRRPRRGHAAAGRPPS